MLTVESKRRNEGGKYMCIKTMGSDKTDRIKFGKLNPLLKVLKKKNRRTDSPAQELYNAFSVSNFQMIISMK